MGEIVSLERLPSSCCYMVHIYWALFAVSYLISVRQSLLRFARVCEMFHGYQPRYCTSSLAVLHLESKHLITVFGDFNTMASHFCTAPFSLIFPSHVLIPIERMINFLTIALVFLAIIANAKSSAKTIVREAARNLSLRTST